MQGSQVSSTMSSQGKFILFFYLKKYLFKDFFMLYILFYVFFTAIET